MNYKYLMVLPVELFVLYISVSIVIHKTGKSGVSKVNKTIIINCIISLIIFIINTIIICTNRL